MKNYIKIIIILLLINSSYSFARDNNLEIINETQDNLFVYAQYTNWKIASDIAENILVAIINVFEVSMSVPSFTPFVKIGGGILFHLKPSEIYKSSSVKDIHKLFIQKASDEEDPNKKIKKKNFDLRVDQFKVEGKEELQDKIDVKIGKTTKVYIESKNDSFNIWATQANK